MPSGRFAFLIATVLVGFTTCALAQHYCEAPFCTSKQGDFGKYTQATSEPTVCYDWIFRYLNNVVPGSSNRGHGYREAVSLTGEPIVETYDTSSSDVFAMENDECGLSLGSVNISKPMTQEERALAAQGRRLETGKMHQCVCSLNGRAHIINATTQAAGGSVNPATDPKITSKDQTAWWHKGGINSLFGLHNVKCAFHSSGPCLLEDVERGVARSWEKNFSKGYSPLMDNNLMLWTPTLGPLLDLFARDGVSFYPMRWRAHTEGGVQEVFSIIASPCGKVLIEVAATDAGGRPKEQFHAMPIARAVLKQWNEPAGQPLVPLRISRAVTPELMEPMLEFYGAKGGDRAVRLGFHTQVLLDETDADGARAVTLKLSANAKVHMQLWARPEESQPAPWTPNPSGGFAQDFSDSKASNQVTGKSLPRAAGFCSDGAWSVQRYTWYVLQTHKATLEPPPPNASTLTPPAGKDQNVFIDDHVSWDCTSPECEVSAGTRSLYEAGSHITHQKYTPPFTNQSTWWPYSHDPAGYGIELHWFHARSDFQPQGELPQICFIPYDDGTCPGSRSEATALSVRELVVE